jgi:hypothetical protein
MSHEGGRVTSGTSSATEGTPGATEGKVASLVLVLANIEIIRI